MAEFTFSELDTIIQNAQRALETGNEATRRDARQAIEAARQLRLRRAGQVGEEQSLGRIAGNETVAQVEGALQGFADLGLGLATGAAAAGRLGGAQLDEAVAGDQQGVAQSGGLGQRAAEALEFSRGRTRAIREDAPIAEVAGTFGGVAGLATRGAQALQNAPRAVRDLVGRRQGQPVANVRRAAVAGGATGAGAGASQAAVEGRDIGRSSLIGGLGGAVLGPAFGAIANLGVRGLQRLLRSDDAAFRILSRISNEDPDVLRQRVQQFRDEGRRDPTVAEVVDRETAEEFGAINQLRPSAGRVTREGAERITQSRQETLPRALTGGRLQTTAGRQEARRTASVNRQFEAIADRPVAMTLPLRNFLNSGNVRQLVRSQRIAPERAARLADVAEGQGDLTVRDLEEIRRAAADAAGEGGGDFREVANRARELLTQQVPEADAALLEQASRGERIAGVQQGRRILRPEGEEDLGDFLSPDADFSIDRAAGARGGTRRTLSLAAGESARSAESTARQLGSDRGVQRRLDQVFRPQEAQRLRSIGQQETRSAENLRAAVPSGRLVEPDVATEVTQAAGEAAIVGSNRGSGAFNLNVITRGLNALRIPPTASRRLAEALLDPARSEEAIRRLRELGVGDDQLSRIVNAAAVTGGVSAAQAGRQ